MNATRNILIQIPFEYVSGNKIHNKSTLFEIMAWRRKGSNPRLQRMMTRHPEKQKEETSRICYPEMSIVKNPLRYRH